MLNSRMEVLARIVEETIEATPDGVPGGYIYAALMQYINLDQFYQVMELVMAGGNVKKVGEVYMPIE